MPSFTAGSAAKKTQTVPADSPGKQELSNSLFQFEDNRPETAVQRQLAGLANASVFKDGPDPLLRKAEAMGSPAPVVQRVVLKARRSGRWYTDRDSSQLFDTKEEAEIYQRELISRELEEKENKTREKRMERTKKRRRELDEQFGDYAPPKAKRARLFKDNDKKFDDVNLTTLGPDNAKKFMEFSFQQRRADEFRTQAINLGGFHHVLAPGTDIGLTPAVLRPDLGEGHSLVPLSRDGKAKPYTELAAGLDQLAEDNVTSERSLNEVRERIGKDLMRMTRGNPPDGTFDYTGEQLALLNEIAAVLRLDKGRVPKATRYIRRRITRGDLSFHDLFAKSKYVGAGSGGVEALRGQVEEDGEQSEGSDMEVETMDEKQMGSTAPEQGQYMSQGELFAAVLEGREQVGSTVLLHPSGEWIIASIRMTYSGQSVNVNLRLRRRGG